MIYSHGNLTIDVMTAQVEVSGKPVNLTMIEYRILLIFFAQPGCIVTVKAIEQALWNGYVSSDNVYTRMSRLRQKIEKAPSHPEHIVSRWGHGYIMPD